MTYPNKTDFRKMSESALEEGRFTCHSCSKKAVRFFQGDPYCEKHFILIRREYNRNYHNKYYWTHREKALELQKRYHKKHYVPSKNKRTPEEQRLHRLEYRKEYNFKHKEQNRKWRLKNRDEINKKQRDRYWENPEKFRSISRQNYKRDRRGRFK